VATYDCGLPALSASNVPRPSGAGGALTVLSWAGRKAAVTYTFDDGNSSQIAHYSELAALNVPFTFYLQTNKTEATNAVWTTALAAGHEIGNHSQSHLQDPAESVANTDVDAATQFIISHFGVTPYTFAAPWGSAIYSTVASTRFLINRGVANGLVLPNDSTTPFKLPCYIPPDNASASLFNHEVDDARNRGGWKIVLVHGFKGGADGAFQPVAIGEFLSAVNYAKGFNDVWIGTMQDVAAYWRAQELFSTLTPSSSGSSKVWSWTLPAHFPPNKCLRVTVPGGTLTQGGQTLPWNPQGFYEVSLDAGPLTLTP